MFISKTCLGSASLAQVHKAVLKDGCSVAVKVQHKDIHDHSTSDVKTMEVCHFFFEFYYK